MSTEASGGEKALAVWADDERVGDLSTTRGTWSFEYAPTYATAEGAFPLSPHFPLAQRQQVDTADDRRVEWFFDNLLPEGGVRTALASYALVSARDTFGLLRRFGEESAGALSLLPASEPKRPAALGTYAPLRHEELHAWLHDLPSMPLITAHGRAKMSLAGAQHKLGVRWKDGALFLPEGGAASTHILKPDNARPEVYPFCPANEHFVMSLARAVGLPVPETMLLHIPEAVYVIARYDRFLREDVVRRRHQIDLCQMANKWPGYKYESQGGATLDDVFAAADSARQPALAKNNLLRWIVFNYIVGNSDAHAKNVSFLVSSTGFDLAPFYDLLSVKVYGDETLAMSVGGEERYGLVTSGGWDALAAAVGVRPALVRRIRRELARAVPREAAALLDAPSYTAEERAFLERIVAVTREHAAFVEQGL